MTPQERKLWYYLRLRNIKGAKFRRQHPIGPYIVDFICLEQKLIIEIDGGQHNQNQYKEKDSERTNFLNAKGYNVLRYWNTDIDNNIMAVLNDIKSHLQKN